jgi:hypothetical protein
MDDYEYDVFLSYQRLEQWPQWVLLTFLPILKTWLATQLGRRTEIFVDQAMSEGKSWPNELGVALARSRVLVPLFCRSYFGSRWCVQEFALMVKREEMTGFNFGINSQRLIIPALIHDGEYLPDNAKEIQSCDLSEYANPRTVPRGPTEEALSQAIKKWVPSIEAAIDAAPPFEREWEKMNVKEMVRQFKRRKPIQRKPPRI